MSPDDHPGLASVERADAVHAGFSASGLAALNHEMHALVDDQRAEPLGARRLSDCIAHGRRTDGNHRIAALEHGLKHSRHRPWFGAGAYNDLHVRGTE